MNSHIRAIWLGNLEHIARGTLSTIDKRIEETGTLTEDHETMSNLCMGYLYLLSCAEEAGLLDTDSSLPIIKRINKTETIH